ncbi:hypothetical protein EVJ58_g7724 [Rhodofomes roseus]|uniref:Cytochrome P450 n=1 Tax=Rhodofomes roseus TaxID=34475 RepID=A0A4Y9Y4G1_9APHY|nr:hypothetical protein EVJ58_g7724 [Rhodofomes roseus]
MLIKEEHIFQEAEDSLTVNSALFGTSLASTLGGHHAKQRKLINPAFSVNHMREMLPLFYDVTRKLRDAVASRITGELQEVDMYSWLSRTALELIGQGGLGYSFDPLVEDCQDEYGDTLNRLTPNLDSLLLFRKLVPWSTWLPTWMRRGFMQLFPAGSPPRNLVHIIDTMDRRSREIYTEKKHAFENGDAEVVKQVGSGKDILSILMRANSAADVNDRLPEEEVISQMNLFIAAGQNTTTNATARTLQILAEKPAYQARLRKELLEARAADGLLYDELNHLPLLDSIIRETLRLGSPPRTVDGKQLNEIPVPKGTEFFIGSLGCNANKRIWGEDSLEWKPERWLPSLATSVTDARIPGAYSNLMTFLVGKRACIGFKFAEMGMKVLLAMLISHFTFELSEQPVVWNVAAVVYPSVGYTSLDPELPMKVSLYDAELQ